MPLPLDTSAKGRTGKFKASEALDLRKCDPMSLTVSELKNELKAIDINPGGNQKGKLARRLWEARNHMQTWPTPPVAFVNGSCKMNAEEWKIYEAYTRTGRNYEEMYDIIDDPGSTNIRFGGSRIAPTGGGASWRKEDENILDHLGKTIRAKSVTMKRRTPPPEGGDTLANLNPDEEMELEEEPPGPASPPCKKPLFNLRTSWWEDPDWWNEASAHLHGEEASGSSRSKPYGTVNPAISHLLIPPFAPTGG